MRIHASLLRDRGAARIALDIGDRMVLLDPFQARELRDSLRDILLDAPPIVAVGILGEVFRLPRPCVRRLEEEVSHITEAVR